MTEVNKNTYFDLIKDLDVISDISNEYPFTTTHKIRYGIIIGKIVESWSALPKKRPVITKYFINS